MRIETIKKKKLKTDKMNDHNKNKTRYKQKKNTAKVKAQKVQHFFKKKKKKHNDYAIE